MMTRTEFEAAYRDARCTLNTFLEREDRRGRIPTRDEARAAEQRWIDGCAGPGRAAFLSLGAQGPPAPLSRGALFCYFNHIYDDRFSFPQWVREKLASRTQP